MEATVCSLWAILVSESGAVSTESMAIQQKSGISGARASVRRRARVLYMHAADEPPGNVAVMRKRAHRASGELGLGLGLKAIAHMRVTRRALLP